MTAKITDSLPYYQQALEAVQNKIALAEQEREITPYCTDLHKVRLIAVSKTKPLEAIEALYHCGQRDFGENRVQEAQSKFTLYKPDDLVLHLLGPLQTNKVKEAVALFDVFHALDRPKLAQTLAKECDRQNRRLDCFIQVNTGAEPQKAGIAALDCLEFVTYAQGLGLSIKGLMCIPPQDQNPAPHFALLRKLAQQAGLDQLSMGMSSDYPSAIRLGATHVRVGTALFGAR